MAHLKIKNVFTCIRNGIQWVGFHIGDNEKCVFLSPAQVRQCTNVNIDEVEILIGSTLSPEFYKAGETMFNGKVCETPETQIKDFWIEPSGTIEEMRELNSDKIKPYKKIKKVFQFHRNGKDIVGFDVNEEKAIFINANSLAGFTKLDPSEFHILVGSYVIPVYYQKGENIYEGMDRPPEPCRKSNMILKYLDLRMYGNAEQMHEDFEANAPNYYTADQDNYENFGYQRSYEKYGGSHGYDDMTIDVAFEGDPANIWNVL